jgi:hypothetical protein
MKRVFSFLIFAAALFAQSPNIQSASTFTSATPGPSVWNSPTTGVATWQLTFTATGFTAVTVQLESSEDCTGTPCGTWTAVSSTYVTQGTNPLTWSSTASPPTNTTITLQFAHPWLRVNLTSATGTGTVNTLLLGYKGTTPGGAGGGGGGATTRTWPFYSEGVMQAGVCGFRLNTPSPGPVACSGLSCVTTGAGTTDPVCVEEWAIGQSTYYGWAPVLLPPGYTVNSAISYTITSRSADTTHAAIVTPYWGCVSTGAFDAQTWTAVTPINITGAAALAGVITTATIIPTCASGNTFSLKLKVDTNTNAMTQPFDLIRLYIAPQGSM